MSDKYFFVINPAAGEGRKLSFVNEIRKFCMANNMGYDFVYTKRPKHGTELAREASKKYQVVVAVGGDGTVNEVVNGIVNSNASLGTIPIGSGNDFSKQIGLSSNLYKDLRILMLGKTREVDIGMINKKYYFINGFGIGFDGEVASRVRSYMKYSKGFGAYLLAVLRTLATYNYKKVKVEFDNGHHFERPLLLIATCNGTTYGGGFQIAPSAKIDDGLFTICVIDQMSRFYALRNIPKIMKGTHIGLPEVHTYTSRSVKIESAGDMQSQMDGELLPLARKWEVELHNNKINVITV